MPMNHRTRAVYQAPVSIDHIDDPELARQIRCAILNNIAEHTRRIYSALLDVDESMGIESLMDELWERFASEKFPLSPDEADHIWARHTDGAKLADELRERYGEAWCDRTGPFRTYATGPFWEDIFRNMEREHQGMKVVKKARRKAKKH